MTERLPLTINIQPYLRDHHFEGKVILPAVEEMIFLANAVHASSPEADCQRLTGARFSRFLVIPEEKTAIDALVEIEKKEEKIIARLLTAAQTKSGISRTLEHASVEFPLKLEDMKQPSFCPDKLHGNCINIPSAKIYRELVHFGKSFQNITGDLSVSEEGALCYLSGGRYNAASDVLGSPFVFDAAMHAACVWGQRYRDVVAFPVGFARREIYRKTKKGGSYISRINPASPGQDTLLFDIAIYEESGGLCELIMGLEMRDVTGGRMKPPQWIVSTTL